jgi:hypothetical protein
MGLTFHNVLTFTFSSPMENSTARFMTSSSTVFLKILSDVLSFLRRSCSFKYKFLIPLLHSGPFRHLFFTVGPL